MNMGSLFLAITWTLIVFPIYYCAKCCTTNEYYNCKKVTDYFKVDQFWGTPLDVMMGAYIEIAFACFINWSMFTTKGETYNYGVFINNVYLCFFSVLLVAFPAWLYYFLKKNYFSLQLRTVEEMYGNCYTGI